MRVWYIRAPRSTRICWQATSRLVEVVGGYGRPTPVNNPEQVSSGLVGRRRLGRPTDPYKGSYAWPRAGGFNR